MMAASPSKQTRDTPSKNQANFAVIAGAFTSKPARDRRRHDPSSVRIPAADRVISPRIRGTNRYKAARDSSTTLSTDSRIFSCNSACKGGQAGA
jgi:hypothetical protein